NKNNEQQEIKVESNKNNEQQEIKVESNKNNEQQEIKVESNKNNEQQEIKVESNKNNEQQEIKVESNKNNEQEIKVESNKNNEQEIEVESNKNNEHECGRKKVGEEWCEKCDRELFQSNFSSWTSGNEHIDAFIRETQLSATTRFNFLEWIPFDQLTEIERIGSGGFGEVFSARWIEGPRTKWNAEKSTWERYPNVKVALKSLIKLKEEDVTGDLFQELLLHMKANTQVSGRINTLRTFGMSYDPEQKAYMIVMVLADEGDLGAYLKSNFSSLTYIKRLELLYDIASGLIQIHKSGLVHRDLHSGNVMCMRYKNEKENRDDYRCVIGTWLNQCLFSPDSDIAEEFARGEKHQLKEPLLQVLSPSYNQHSVFIHVNVSSSSEIPVEDHSELKISELEIDMSDDE
ncbi:15269_t:CDS:2, partial [Acaulospora morrowiae]